MHADALGDLAVGNRELEPGLPGLGDLPVRSRRTHHDDPLGAVLVAQSKTLGDGRDAKRRRARAERSACDVDRAVSVAVGLDHRPEL